METITCLDSTATLYGLFDPSLAPPLLYYAYLPIIFVSLILGILVFVSRKDFTLPHKLFFTFTILYSLYLLNEIIQWVSVPAGIVEFAWSIIALFFTLISVNLLYFVYTYITKKDASLKYKFIGAGFFIPILLLLPTSLNTTSFDNLNCESSIGPLYYYVYTFILITGILITGFCLVEYHKNKKLELLFIMIGSIMMLSILVFADVISETVGNYEINLIGPIGMIVFISSISYIIVKFKAFNVKLAGAQALVFGIVTLIGSQLFFVETAVNTMLVSMTLIASTIGGWLLVRSVKKEISLREEVETLAGYLETANVRLQQLDKQKSEFVSIASHQLRSPLTSIRGYASLLLEGSFGKIPKKAEEPLTRIAESSKLMAIAVEDYLNVSRIESGNMKYNLSDFNLRDEVEHVCDDLRADALKRGLVLIFRTDLNSRGVINADIGKTVQIVQNLIHNSIKYTEKGTVKVLVRDDIRKKKIYVDIIDTGIGMSKKTQQTIFQKFERADNANSVNTSGTGLGLYVAVKMAEAMGGGITAFSEGDGKGSRFTIEMPLAL